MSRDKGVDDDMPALGDTTRDKAVVLAKGALGSIPFVGSLVAELVGAVIPQQRTERLEDYVRKLDERLDAIEPQVIRERLRDPERIDLFEEGAVQTTRALSEERRAYIATVVATGISGDDHQKIQAKRILALLAEIDDDQIVILASYLMKNRGNEFRDRHASVLDPVVAYLGGDQEEIDRATLHELSRLQLVRLGLLRARYKKPKKGELPEFDDKTGAMAASGREITPLGRLLLVNIGLAEPGEF